jgi:hypothetical protein
MISVCFVSSGIGVRALQSSALPIVTLFKARDDLSMSVHLIS